MHSQDPILPPWVVLHLPHASTAVPPSLRDQFLVDDAALAAEMDTLTDHHVLDLFLDAGCSSPNVRASVSRLVVDVERFADDDLEPAAAHGFGAIYTMTTTGQPLRRSLDLREREALLRRHEAHHERLAVAVYAALRRHGRCLVLDCHTFPDRPLPFEAAGSDQDRPDICIGTDPVHTPPELVRSFVAAFEQAGWTVAVNWPFAGALVPAGAYGQDAGVLAIMVEVNRRICRSLKDGPVQSPDHPVARRVRDCCATAIGGFLAKTDASVSNETTARPWRAIANLQTFEVGDSGTLRDAGHCEPTTRAEFFECEVDGWSRSPFALADTVDSFEPMAWALRRLYEDAREDLQVEIDELERKIPDEDIDYEEGEEVPAPDVIAAMREQLRSKQSALEEMPAEPHEGASDWVRGLDAETFRDRVVPCINAWLADSPGVWEQDYISDRTTGQGSALAFFRDLDRQSLHALDVAVIEGEHPGSSYYAAELRCDIGEANAAALDAGIPVRFVPSDTVLGPGQSWSGRKSAITDEKVRAYTETDYRVDGSPPIVLRIGAESHELAELHAQWGVDESAFVTACNPNGQALGEAENAERHAALREELGRRRLRCIDGAGRHPTSDWPAEQSLLVLGLGLEEARELGNRWQQDAIVWIGADAAPRLILLR